MRAKQTLETLIAFPLAILVLVIGIHVQHNPTGRVAKLVYKVAEGGNHG